MSKAFDIIVFGASGFTGQFVVRELALTIMNDKLDIKWGIAGRSKEKLESVLVNVSKELKTKLDNVSIFISDVHDDASLVEMTKSCKVLLNCVGPYRLYGEQVVKACLASCTDYLDITGEPFFMEKTLLDYGQQAEDSNTLIISACGFDSIPAEIGLVLTRKAMGENNIHTVESLFTSKAEKGGSIHVTTLESALYGIRSSKDLKPLREKLDLKVNYEGPKLKLHKLWTFPGTNILSIPFIGADASVVRRSQFKLQQAGKAKAIQYGAYFGVGNYLNLFMLLVGGLFVFALNLFDFGQKLIMKYPEFFTFGLFSHKGPTREQQECMHFSLLFKATGQDANGRELQLVTKFSGIDAGYLSTSIFLVHSGLEVLLNRKGLAFKGGVISPGAVFYGTNLPDRFFKRGIKFEVMK